MKIQGVKKGTLVLTADLKHIPIEKIDVGDLVIGFAFGNTRYLKFVETRVLKKTKGENYVYRVNYRALRPPLAGSFWRLVAIAEGRGLRM